MSVDGTVRAFLGKEERFINNFRETSALYLGAVRVTFDGIAVLAVKIKVVRNLGSFREIQGNVVIFDQVLIRVVSRAEHDVLQNFIVVKRASELLEVISGDN